MKRTSAAVLLVMVMGISHLYAQEHDLGFKTSAGVSKMYESWKPSGGSRHFFYQPSVNAGIYYRIHIDKHSLFGIDLMLMQMESKERLHSSAYYYTDTAGSKTYMNIDDVIRKHITYFCVPFYYGLKLKKLSLYTGIQACFSLNTRIAVDYNNTFPATGEIQSWRESNSYKGKINTYRRNFGFREEVEYQLNKRFAVSATYYFGVNNLLPLRWIYFYKWWHPWKVRQITFGIRYRLYARAI